MRPHITFCPAVVAGVHHANHSARSVPDGTTLELASGQVAISVIPRPSWGSGAGEQLDFKETDLTHETIATFLEGFSKTISVSSNESCEWQDTEEKTCDQCWSPSDIVDWSNMIVDENEKTSKVPPLIPTSFEKGICWILSAGSMDRLCMYSDLFRLDH